MPVTQLCVLSAYNLWTEEDTDGDDEDHLQAYMTLRQTRQRISPVVFMKYLQHRYESVTTWESTSHEFWAVEPRAPPPSDATLQFEYCIEFAVPPVL